MKKRILVLMAVYFLLILTALFISCKEKDGEEVVAKICVYKLNDTQTNGGCLPNCPPRRTFELCDDKVNAFKYDLEKYEIEDCDCR